MFDAVVIRFELRTDDSLAPIDYTVSLATDSHAAIQKIIIVWSTHPKQITELVSMMSYIPVARRTCDCGMCSLLADPFMLPLSCPQTLTNS